MKHQYVLVGANKYFEFDKFLPYVGLVVGYGQIDWKYDPINNSKDVNADANSFIVGLNLGINYNITKDMSLNLNSKVLFHDYETNIEPQTGIQSTI